MKTIVIADLAAAVALLDGEGDAAHLEDAIGYDALRDSKFWMNELKNLSYDYYLSYHGQEEDEDEDFDATGDLSELAYDALRAAVAEQLGITAKHVAADQVSVRGEMRPISEFTDQVIEKVMDKMLVSPPAPQAADALPARAVKYGDPQIMGGLGAWDNTRYFANDEDESK
jgi:hypothetical protein